MSSAKVTDFGSVILQHHTLTQRKNATPFQFFICLLLIFILVLLINREGNSTISSGILLSFITCSVLWVVAQRFLRCMNFGAKFMLLFNLLLLLKVIVGLVFIDSSIGNTSYIAWGPDDLRGDTWAIHLAAEKFLSNRLHFGLWGALQSDYISVIHTKGVAILYGSLYNSFGPYPSITIPWHALAMGFVCLIVAAMCDILSIEKKTIKLVILLIIIMPGFFVGGILYRDQFMLLLIMLCAFASIYAAINKNYESYLIAFICGWFLSYLRDEYIVLPLVAILSAHYVVGKYNLFKFAKVFIIGVSIFAILVYLKIIPLDQFISRIFSNNLTELYSHFSLFSGNIITNVMGKIVYMLLTPMPWWQVTVHKLQIFDYAQTFFSLTILAILLMDYRTILAKRNLSFLILLWGFLFLMAVFGTQLHTRYFVITIPLLIPVVAEKLKQKWVKGFYLSATVITLAHFALSIL
jgi:hypothetical protein